MILPPPLLKSTSLIGLLTAGRKDTTYISTHHPPHNVRVRVYQFRHLDSNPHHQINQKILRKIKPSATEDTVKK